MISEAYRGCRQCPSISQQLVPPTKTSIPIADKINVGFLQNFDALSTCTQYNYYNRCCCWVETVWNSHLIGDTRIRQAYLTLASLWRESG
jgi:hypothetical protein